MYSYISEKILYYQAVKTDLSREEIALEITAKYKRVFKISLLFFAGFHCVILLSVFLLTNCFCSLLAWYSYIPKRVPSQTLKIPCPTQTKRTPCLAYSTTSVPQTSPSFLIA
jgi:hypothetical protein